MPPISLSSIFLRSVKYTYLNTGIVECWFLDIEGIIGLDRSVFGNLKIDAGYMYFVAEDLVLWARSETIGYAMNPAANGTGMMEYWNVGMLGLVEWDLFL